MDKEAEDSRAAVEEPESENIDDCAAAPKKRYSKEHKLKRYYGILREFMVYYQRNDQAYPSDHEFTEEELRAIKPYPADHEFTDEELRAIDPQDIVNWMNVKMFGTREPDFTKPISGSHHTLSFYRKALSFFMPGGMHDWNPLEKTGNPTRSKQVRNLIKKVKDLNSDGIATPGRQKKKRSSEDGSGDQKLKQNNGSEQKKKAKTITNEKKSTAESTFALSVEVSTLLHQMHAQKDEFMAGLEQISAAVERMKTDVDISYGLMIGRLSNIGSRLTAQIATSNPEAAAAADGTPASQASSLPPIFRARNLFTIWCVHKGKLSPLAADWTFPARLTVMGALNMWLLGEPASHTPPLQYLAVGHMKHIKGAVDNFNKLRRFLTVVKYLGLKHGYWFESNWSSDKIATLWRQILPSIATHLGPMNNDAKVGCVNCRTMINNLTKNGGITKEMADNQHIFSDEFVASLPEKSSQEAPPQHSATTTHDSSDLELQWGIHHGKLNPLPADWEFPTSYSIIEVLRLWLMGEPEPMKVPPLRYVTSSYVGHIKSGTGYLSKLRCVMKVVNHCGEKLGCWYEDGWDEEKVTYLWHTVWDDIGDRIKFKNVPGRDGAVTWQSVYNKMHKKGLIKEVNASQDKDGDMEDDVDDLENNVNHDLHESV